MITKIGMSLEALMDLACTYLGDITSPSNMFLKGSILGGTQGGLLGAGIGGVRAALLSDEEKAQLRKEYGLDQDANLVLRSMGRGALAGGLAGGLLSGGIGSYAANKINKFIENAIANPGDGDIIAENAQKFGNNALLGSAIALPAVSGLSSYLGTNKYS